MCFWYMNCLKKKCINSFLVCALSTCTFTKSQVMFTRTFFFLVFQVKVFLWSRKAALCFCSRTDRLQSNLSNSDYVCSQIDIIRMFAHVYLKKSQFRIHYMPQTVGFQNTGIPRRTRENNKQQYNNSNNCSEKQNKNLLTACVCYLLYRRLKKICLLIKEIQVYIMYLQLSLFF